VGTSHISGTADRLRRCQLSLQVSVIHCRWTTVDQTHFRDLYSAARLSRKNILITIWCDTEYFSIRTTPKIGVVRVTWHFFNLDDGNHIWNCWTESRQILYAGGTSSASFGVADYPL